MDYLVHNNQHDNQTKMNYFSFVPEEVLMIIFEEVVAPKDFYSCYQTCPRFQRVLHPDLSRRLFPAAFYELLKGGYLDKQTLLTCRLVCKRWRALIEHFAIMTHTGDYNNKTLTRYVSVFHDTTSMTKCLDLMTSIHQPASISKHPNSFVTRSVSFDDRNYAMSKTDMQNYWSSVVNLIETVGGHVFHCNLGINYAPHLSYSEILLKLLPAMPALRYLRISIPIHSTNDLKGLCSAKPLPQMKHLEELRLLRVNTPIATAIFSNAPVKKLRIDTGDHEFHKDLAEIVKLDQLEQLHIECTISSLSTLVMLQAADFATQLKSLRLPNMVLMSTLSREPPFDFSKLITGLNSFVNLAHLELGFREKCLSYEYSPEKYNTSLELPKLKSLSIHLPSAIHLQFVENLTSLEYLHLVTDSIVLTAQVDRLIRWTRHENGAELYRAKIWDVVPTLKRARIDVAPRRTINQLRQGFKLVYHRFSPAIKQQPSSNLYTSNSF